MRVIAQSSIFKPPCDSALATDKGNCRGIMKASDDPKITVAFKIIWEPIYFSYAY